MVKIDDISKLQVSINAEANNADKAIDNLVRKVGQLATSLSSVEGKSYSSITKALGDLTVSAKGLNSANVNSFNNLAQAVKKLDTISAGNLKAVSSELKDFSKDIASIGDIKISTSGLSEISDIIRSFGYKTGTSGASNIALLKDNLVGLISGLNSVGGANIENLDVLVKQINKLGSTSTQRAVSNIQLLSQPLAELSATSNNFTAVEGLTELASAISKLGGVTAERAISNLPLLTTELSSMFAVLSQAPQINRNIIDTINAMANLSSQGAKVGTASRRINSGFASISNNAQRTKKSVTSLAYAFGKFYASAWVFIRAFKGVWSAINNTADYLEAYNYFEVALNQVGTDWSHQWEQYAEELGISTADEYVDSFKTRLTNKLSGMSGLTLSVDSNGNGLLTESGLKNLGLNIQEVTQYASELASVTNSLGLTGEATLATSSTLTKLGADISSLFNEDYSDVMTKIRSGLTGQSRALYSYGLDITNATLQTYAYNLGLSKSVSEMTQAEKIQIRLLAILDQSRISWSDQANTINSLSNSIRQFKNNLSEAGMVLGQLFVPIMSKAMPIVNGLTIAIKRLLVNIAGLLGIKIDLSSFGQGGLSEDMDDLSDSLDDVTDSANSAKAGLRAFDELNVISLGSSSGSSDSLYDSIDLTDEILKATEEYEKVWQEAYDRMENLSSSYADKFATVFEPIEKIFSDLANGDFYSAGYDISKLVQGIYNFFSTAIANVDWSKLGENIGLFLAGVDWVGVIKSALKLRINIFEAIAEVWFSSMEAAPIETAIITAIGLLKFTNLGSVLGGALGNATISSGDFTVFSSKFASALSTALTGAVAGIGLGKVIAKEVFGEEDVIKDTLESFNDGTWKEAISLACDDAKKEVDKSLSEISETIKRRLEWISNEINETISDMLTVPNSVFDDWTEKLISLFRLPTSTGSVRDNLVQSGSTSTDSGETGFDINAVDDYTKKVLVDLGLVSEGYYKLAEVSEQAAQSSNAQLKSMADTSSMVAGQINNTSLDGFRVKTLNTFIQTANTSNSQLETIQKTAQTTFSGSKWSFSGVTSGLNGTFSSARATAEAQMQQVKARASTLFSTSNFTFSGVNTGLKASFSTAFASVKNIFNQFVTLFNTKFKINFSSSALSVLKKFGTTIASTINLGTIPTFQTGGIVEDGLFMANHNELVGGFANGKTAVANNEQITTGIANAVYRGNQNVVSVMQQELTETRKQNDILTKILAKEFGISQNDVGRAAQKFARDYSLRTGREAYSF